MTGLVRGLVAGLAGALVTLAAHYGLQLDQETVAIVLTAVVGALASGALHWAERHIPAVNRAANWVGRHSGELTLLHGKTAEPRRLGVREIATTTAGNVRIVDDTGRTIATAVPAPPLPAGWSSSPPSAPSSSPPATPPAGPPADTPPPSTP